MKNYEAMAAALGKLVQMEKLKNPQPRNIQQEIEAINIALTILKNNREKRKDLLLKLKSLMQEKKLMTIGLHHG
jgi:hypothetical protein